MVVKKRTRTQDEDEEEVKHSPKDTSSTAASQQQKRYAIAVDSSAPSEKGSYGTGTGTIDLRNTDNNINRNNHITTAALAQQQQHEQIREFLMQQSALRASSSSVQQQRNLDLLSSVQQQEQQQRLLLSSLTSINDRNDDLQRLLILDRLERSEPMLNQYSDQDLRMLLLQRQNIGGNINLSNNVAHSLSSSQSLSEQYQQQQMNILAASTNMQQRRAAMNSNDLLLQEMLMTQSRNNDPRNLYATAASINDNVGSRLSANALPMRFGQRPSSGIVRATSDQSTSNRSSAQSSATSNLRAIAAARLLSPRNKETMSTEQKSEVKMEEELGSFHSQSNISDIALLQRQLQDPNTIADRNREVALAALLDARTRYAMGEVLDRTTMNNIPAASAIQQLQRMQREQQLAAAQEEAFRAAALQSLLASNNHSNTLRAHATTDRTTIPNMNITTIPMDCESDQQQLSKYQVLIRRQLEYFVSQEDDVAYSVQGRKKQILVGQVGIRCRHCSYLPHRLRGRGAGYYPAKLSGVYQAAQNMATNHLNQHCNVIPAPIREELCSLRGGRHESSAGGGKQYWTNKCTEIGLMEHDDSVYFKGCHIPDIKKSNDGSK